MSKKIILVGGGARSGKSAFALDLARTLGERRIFLATAAAGDAEMSDRIALHKAERGSAFTTIEEERDIVPILRNADCDVLVLDCLTLWIANVMPDVDIESLIAKLLERRFHSIIVTNEVGMGIVPDNKLARDFRDATGIAHQKLARIADEVHFAALGCVLKIK